ncbi:MAG TPA: hypothetical protein VF331_19665 [Polyangiales bacterium]
MSTLACPECGSPLDEDSPRCAQCRARVRGRKRGELSGVRIDHERLDAVLPSRESVTPDGQWGSARATTPTSLEPRGLPPPTAREAADQSRGHEAIELANAAAAERPARIEPAKLEHAAVAELPGPGRVARAPQTLEPPNTPEPVTPTTAMQATIETPNTESAPAEDPGPAPLDAEVVVVMAASSTASPAAITSGTPTQLQTPIPPPRPPVLASEALLRDMAPAEPAPRVLRGWAPALGTVGALAVWWLTLGEGLGVPLIGAFVALAMLGLSPMPYAARAWAIVMVSGSALSLLLWSNVSSPMAGESLLLTLVVTVLATGLHFRAWHRGSVLARVMVMVGAFGGAVFLWVSGEFSDLTMTDTAWQSWAPRLLGVPFGMLLMLALLAFMDSRTTGGTSVWGSAVLVWYGLYTYVELMCAVWPKAAPTADLSLATTSMLLSWVSGPLLTALLALGIAQVLAAVLATAASSARTRRSQWPT